MAETVVKWKVERANGRVYLRVEFPIRPDDWYSCDMSPQQAIEIGEALACMGKQERKAEE